MPDLPTVSEAGVPGFQSGSWQGLLAPAGTPPEIVAKIHDAVVKVLNEPEMKQRLADQGAEVVANTPEEFAVFIREDTAKWATDCQGQRYQGRIENNSLGWQQQRHSTDHRQHATMVKTLKGPSAREWPCAGASG